MQDDNRYARVDRVIDRIDHGMPESHRRYTRHRREKGGAPLVRGIGVGVTCSKEGCSKATTERKPYCSDHVDELPHARAVLAMLDDSRVRACADVLLTLESHGSALSRGRLHQLVCSMSGYETKVFDDVLGQLAREGRISLVSVKKRNGQVVQTVNLLG
jgi:hypothetical protein